jgi:hypothetical protein
MEEKRVRAKNFTENEKMRFLKLSRRNTKVKSESRNNACASLHIRDVTILLRLSALVNATRMTTGVRLNMSK